MINANIGPAPSNNKNAEMIRVLLPLVVIIILLVAGNSIIKRITGAIRAPFEGLDILDTKEEQEQKKKAQEAVSKQEEAGNNSPFSPNYYKNLQKKGGIWLLTNANATDTAKMIYSSIGFLTDKPEQTLAAFKRCRYRTQVSQVAEIFANRYGVDLLSFINTKLDTTAQKITLGQIINYVNSLPDGRR